MKEVQAILFDLDGVITDTAEYHYQRYDLVTLKTLKRNKKRAVQ